MRKAKLILLNHSGEEFNNHIYPTAPFGQDMTQGQFLSGV